MSGRLGLPGAVLLAGGMRRPQLEGRIPWARGPAVGEGTLACLRGHRGALYWHVVDGA